MSRRYIRTESYEVPCPASGPGAAARPAGAESLLKRFEECFILPPSPYEGGPRKMEDRVEAIDRVSIGTGDRPSGAGRGGWGHVHRLLGDPGSPGPRISGHGGRVLVAVFRARARPPCVVRAPAVRASGRQRATLRGDRRSVLRRGPDAVAPIDRGGGGGAWHGPGAPSGGVRPPDRLGVSDGAFRSSSGGGGSRGPGRDSPHLRDPRGRRLRRGPGPGCRLW